MMLHGIMLPYLVGWSQSVFEMLDKLQKQLRGTAGPTLATSLEPFAHLQYKASLSLSLVINLVNAHLN